MLVIPNDIVELGRKLRQSTREKWIPLEDWIPVGNDGDLILIHEDSILFSHKFLERNIFFGFSLINPDEIALIKVNDETILSVAQNICETESVKKTLGDFTDLVNTYEEAQVELYADFKKDIKIIVKVN